MQKVTIIGIFIFIFLQLPAQASNLCSVDCSFNDFFKSNYEKLVEYLSPDKETKRIFDMLFNAYSIKFEGLDFEYKAKCDTLKEDTDTEDLTTHCLNEQKKYIKNLTEIAQEEYDNFLDDLNFEICGCENSENKAIRRHKKRYRKTLKKLIAKNCK